MAIKHLKDKVINVRATDKTHAILDTLSKSMGISKADVIALALDNLLKEHLKK